MVVYDVTDDESFRAVEAWLGEVDKLASPGVVKLLVGNKADLDRQRKVSHAEGQELARRMGMDFIETSAKTCIHVDECFKKIINEVYNRVVAKKGTPKGLPDSKRTTKNCPP